MTQTCVKIWCGATSTTHRNANKNYLFKSTDCVTSKKTCLVRIADSEKQWFPWSRWRLAKRLKKMESSEQCRCFCVYTIGVKVVQLRHFWGQIEGFLKKNWFFQSCSFDEKKDFHFYTFPKKNSVFWLRRKSGAVEPPSHLWFTQFRYFKLFEQKIKRW